MTTASAVSVTSARIAAEAARLGFRYSEDPQYDLRRTSPDRRIQVRDTAHYAPREAVERYAVQMNHSEFPAITVTRDTWIVDGNTRIGARLYRKEHFHPAIVLDVAWEGASPKVQATLSALAMTLNSQNGMPLTASEIRAAVRTLLGLDWLNEQIGRAIGVRPGTITQVRKQIEAEDRLRRVGLTELRIPEPSLRALGTKDVLALNDEPYQQLAELARDGDLNAREIGVLAREAKETGSDEAALRVIRTHRDEMRDRIQAKQLTGRGRPPASAQLRRFLGNVIKYQGREEELLETDPGLNARHIETLRSARDVLDKVLVMQNGTSA